jgi:hypothetical protein
MGPTLRAVRNSSGEWGIELAGVETARLMQAQPAQVELYSPDGQIRQFAAGYDAVRQAAGDVSGKAVIDVGGGASITISDQWAIADGVVTLDRTVAVTGTRPGAGFSSAIRLYTVPELTWPDVSFLAPGLLYGDPTYNGPRSPGGTLSDADRQFTIREDFLPAPLFGLALRNGETVTLLDMAPRGHSTLEETRTGLNPGVLIDERLSFGGLGAREASNGGVEIGFWLPGSARVLPRPRFAGPGGGLPAGAGPAGGRAAEPRAAGGAPAGAPAAAGPQAAGPPEFQWSHRYNPVRAGFRQQYRIGFRFAAGESFPDLTRDAYRWAWAVLKPQLNWHDMEVVRRSLTDQLSSQVYTIDGRTGLPFIVYTHSGEVWRRDSDPDFYWRATMGFVGKNIEAADQLLREAERDHGPRGQKLRQQGLDVISTFIRLVPMNPPTSTGFNLRSGAPSMTNPPVWYVREATEDMRMLMEAYRRERSAGRDHPEWIAWCRDFADWLMKLQRADGSFPRSFMINTSEIREESGTTSYNVVPLFVMLSQDLHDDRYFAAAVRAAEYVWRSFGTRGVFIGGAIDNPNITDKEAGLLSMEAFLFLYERTKEPKWLHRAQVAGDFAESWMWLWNNPMPDDASDDSLMWKRSAPTVGVQGITAQVAGHVDQYLDWSVPAYARLYRYTGDPHYRELARLLLHNTKAMMAMPGRLYGMVAPGWQTENWRMGAAREGRGFGTPEKWMPWVTTNHLYSITGLEQFDPALFEELSARPRGN